MRRGSKDPPTMPTPPKAPTEPAKGFDERLKALEGERAARPVALAKMGQGYRFLAEVIGGVLMGAGAGWLIDYFAKTEPFGLVIGLFAGAGLSIWVAVKSAMKMSKDEMAKAGPLPSVPDDEDED